jgi:hypothetical protein
MFFKPTNDRQITSDININYLPGIYYGIITERSMYDINRCFLETAQMLAPIRTQKKVTDVPVLDTVAAHVELVK